MITYFNGSGLQILTNKNEIHSKSSVTNCHSYSNVWVQNHITRIFRRYNDRNRRHHTADEKSDQDRA